MAQRLKAAVVGASISNSPDGRERFAIRAHLPALKALSDLYEVVATCTTKMETATAAAKHFNVPHAFDSVERMLRELPEIDVVCVCVQPHLHYQVVMAALNAGKHVYCEQPLGVTTAQAQEMYELAKWGPTASNAGPARFVFLVSEEAKARLAPHMSSSNRPKTLAAPLNVIMAFDLNFWERTPFLFPHKPESGAGFSGNPQLAAENALRNGSLQAAYLMLAARSLGLDCGPMSGFKEPGVNDEFFKGTNWRVNFICNIGYGTNENLFPRLPRLTFDEACRIL